MHCSVPGCGIIAEDGEERCIYHTCLFTIKTSSSPKESLPCKNIAKHQSDFFIYGKALLITLCDEHNKPSIKSQFFLDCKTFYDQVDALTTRKLIIQKYWGYPKEVTTEKLWKSIYVSKDSQEQLHLGEIEDRITIHNKLVISSISPFYTPLKDRNLGKKIRLVSLDANGWNRDPLLKSRRGAYLAGGELLAKSISKLDLSEDSMMKKLERPLHLKSFQHFEFGDSKKNLFKRYLEAISLCAAPYPPIRTLLKNSGSSSPTQLGVHLYSFSGGNVITAQNKIGQYVTIIGNGSILSTIPTVPKINRKFMSPDAFLYRTCGIFDEQMDKWHMAKTSIRSFFLGDEAVFQRLPAPLGAKITREIIGNHTVMFIPQWTYHIDLMIAYVAPSHIFIHDFGLVLQILRKIKIEVAFHLKTHQYFQAFQYYGKLQTNLRFLDKMISITEINFLKYRNITEKAKEKLEKYNFTVTKIPGIFSPWELNVARIEPQSHIKCYELLPEAEYYFSFLNGLPMESEETLIQGEFLNKYLVPCSPQIELHANKIPSQEDFALELPNIIPLVDAWYNNEISIAMVFKAVCYFQFRKQLSGIGVTTLPVGWDSKPKSSIQPKKEMSLFEALSKPQRISQRAQNLTPEINTELWMLKMGGGLRCQSNTLPERIHL